MCKWVPPVALCQRDDMDTHTSAADQTNLNRMPWLWTDYRQTDRQTQRQTDTKIDTQINTHTHTQVDAIAYTSWQTVQVLMAKYLLYMIQLFSLYNIYITGTWRRWLTGAPIRSPLRLCSWRRNSCRWCRTSWSTREGEARHRSQRGSNPGAAQHRQ